MLGFLMGSTTCLCLLFVRFCLKSFFFCSFFMVLETCIHQIILDASDEIRQNNMMCDGGIFVNNLTLTWWFFVFFFSSVLFYFYCHFMCVGTHLSKASNKYLPSIFLFFFFSSRCRFKIIPTWIKLRKYRKKQKQNILIKF